jgi:hypothetical protein
MGTVRVVLRKCRKLKDGRYPVVIRLTHSKKAKYIFTGHSALERQYIRMTGLQKYLRYSWEIYFM